MRILQSFIFSFWVLIPVGSAESVCGVARVIGGNHCRALRLSFDLASCEDTATETAKLHCAGASADAVLKTEKATYHTLLREIAPGVWAAVGQLRRFPRDWQLPALPPPTQLPSAKTSRAKEATTATATGIDSRLLSVGGEFRLRWQKENTLSPSGLLYLRAQPDFLLRPTTDLSLVFQPTLVSRFGDTASGTYSNLRIYQAHLDWHWSDNFRALLGKQVLHFGDGWLLGSSHWENTRRSSDALRMVYENGSVIADVFYARAASGTAFVAEEAHLGGAHLSWALSEEIRIQPFILWLQEANSEAWNQTTAALRTEAVFPLWNAHAQAAWQTGRASALAATAGVEWTPGQTWLSRLGAETFWATRDFQNTFGVPHNQLGLTDAVGRRNTLGASVTAGAGLAGGEVLLSGFLFARTDTALPGYREDSVTKFGSEYASSDRLLGTEWNLAYVKPIGLVELGAEAGVFLPGAFLTSQGLSENLYRVTLTLETRF